MQNLSIRTISEHNNKERVTAFCNMTCFQDADCLLVSSRIIYVSQQTSSKETNSYSKVPKTPRTNRSRMVNLYCPTVRKNFRSKGSWAHQFLTYLCISHNWGQHRYSYKATKVRRCWPHSTSISKTDLNSWGTKFSLEKTAQEENLKNTCSNKCCWFKECLVDGSPAHTLVHCHNIAKKIENNVIIKIWYPLHLKRWILYD